MAKHEEVKDGVIFPVGEKNDAFARTIFGRTKLPSNTGC